MAAALICLAVVSAMLGFDRWPGTAKGDADGTLALRTPAAKADGRAASGPRPAPVIVSTTAPRADAPRRPTSRSRPQRRIAPLRGNVHTSAPTTPDAPRAPQPAAPKPSPAAPATSAPAAPAPAAPPASRPAPAPVTNVVDSTRRAVAPVTDAVPPVVQQPVDQVLDTVQQTAGAVDALLTPRVPRAAG